MSSTTSLRKSMGPSFDRSVWSWLILLGVGTTWGSSYFFIKKALIAFTPYQVGTMRLAITCLCLLPLAIPRLREIKKRHIVPLMVVGTCGSLLPAFLFPLAQQELSSSFTGVLSSSTPIFTLAFGALLFGLRLSKKKILGVGIGFMGAALMIGLAGSGALSGNPFYGIYILLATAFYAMSSNTINKYLTELGTITISSVAFLWIGIPSIVYLWMTDISKVFVQDPHAIQSLASVLILSIAGTALASIFFFQLIKMSGVVFASTVSYIIPCFAVLIGWLDGEVLSWIHALGMSLILCGIYLTSRST